MRGLHLYPICIYSICSRCPCSAWSALIRFFTLDPGCPGWVRFHVKPWWAA